MGNLSNTVPFTELYERLLTMGRIDSPNNIDYSKGIINDVYVRALPRIEDWATLVAESVLSMTAKYNTGTVAVSAGGTAVTGTGTVWTSAMIATDGYKIKFSGNDNIYTFTYVGATSGTISPALSGATAISGGAYTIFRDTYQLASDFDRLLKNGSIYVYSGGRLSDIIEEMPVDKFREEFISEAADPIRIAKLGTVHSSTGYRQIVVNPPPATAKSYPYDYIKQLTPMTDYQVGSAEVTNASTTVTGTDTYWLANAAAGDYFRVDNNGTGDSSKWYKIASVSDNTTIVLETAYGEASESGMEYTISKAPTAYPREFHEFILYEAVLAVTSEQGDPVLEGLIDRRNAILLDLKKNYKSRNTNAQIKLEDGGYRGNW